MRQPRLVVLPMDESDAFQIRFEFHVHVFSSAVFVLAQTGARRPAHLLQHALAELVVILHPVGFALDDVADLRPFLVQTDHADQRSTRRFCTARIDCESYQSRHWCERETIEQDRMILCARTTILEIYVSRGKQNNDLEKKRNTSFLEFHGICDCLLTTPIGTLSVRVRNVDVL